MKLQLRDYQIEGRDGIRAAFRRVRSVLYVLSTGGGKTALFSAISEGAAARGNRVLIIQHRKELIRQASLSLAALGVPHRIIAPPNKVAKIRGAHVDRFNVSYVRPDADVAIASVQSLARRLEWVEEFAPRLLVTDEAHHAVAGTWRRITDALPKAHHLGVTATPCRTNGQGLGEVYDEMVEGPSMGWLIDEGYLVPPKIFAPPLKADLSGVHMRGGDLRADEQADILDTPTITGDAIEHYAKLAPGRPTIVFCCNVKHAEHVAAEFQAAGWDFHTITGNMDDLERDRLIHGLANGAVQGLVSVDVISEGTDIPVAEVAIMLRATESLSLYLQQGGRVLRPVYAEGADLSDAPGRLQAIADSDKQYGLIIDHVGNVYRHGSPQAEQAWSLEGTPPRKRGPRDPDDNLSISQCPECYLAHEKAPQCPNCGHIYQSAISGPRYRDGELEEVQHDPEADARREQRRQQGRARDLESLKAMGMGTKRAQHIIRARQEKERLQNELRDLLMRHKEASGKAIAETWGYGLADVLTMKPKALKENIEAVSQALFHGAANDNQPDLLEARHA